MSSPICRVLHVDADERVRVLKELQALLYDAGWARLGWAPEISGRGGNILHRAAIYEELANAGYPPRFVFEHLEVLLPSLARFGDPTLMAELLPRLLSGEETWSQGFSEPGRGKRLCRCSHPSNEGRRQLDHQWPQDLDELVEVGQTMLGGGPHRDHRVASPRALGVRR